MWGHLVFLYFQCQLLNICSYELQSLFPPQKNHGHGLFLNIGAILDYKKDHYVHNLGPLKEANVDSSSYHSVLGCRNSCRRGLIQRWTQFTFAVHRFSLINR